MRSDTRADQAPSRTRDGLGLLKSVVEFFTSLTGLAKALIALLGVMAAFAVASIPNPSIESGGSSSDPTTVSPSMASPSSPAPSASEDASGVPDAWLQDVNQACMDVATIGLSGLAQTGDLSAAASAYSALAQDLRVSATPSGFEDEARSAANDLDAAASAAFRNDAETATSHANAAGATLRSVGAAAC